MKYPKLLDLATQLITRPSITPNDAGCQALIATYLTRLGFTLEWFFFEDTLNLWATRGMKGPMLCFAGHTDVVPAGNLKSWTSPPFVPNIRNGILYGRGAVDMKGALAAMVIAVETFLQENPNFQKGRLSFLLTSDEEGPFINGTKRVVETLQKRGELIDWCIIGEPSSQQRLGDVIKNGRRGSLTGYLTIHGKQGHVAYPQHAQNPIHLAAPALTQLCETLWDQGCAYFPPTSFQIVDIQAGSNAINVIPGELSVAFNFRFSPASSATQLKTVVQSILDQHQLNYTLNWSLSGEPFLTKPGHLLSTVQTTILAYNGQQAKLCTAGGTSDGRFIAKLGTEVIELGLRNHTIHQVNECTHIDDMEQLCDIYQGILKHIF